MFRCFCESASCVLYSILCFHAVYSFVTRDDLFIVNLVTDGHATVFSSQDSHALRLVIAMAGGSFPDDLTG